MSSSTVRSVARSLPSDPAWPGALPFYETVNDSPSIAALPDSWFTLVFQADADDPVGLGAGGQLREAGRIVLAGFSRSGTADGDLITALEVAAPLLRPHFAASNIFVNSLSPPQESDPGLDGEWFRLDLVVEYWRFH